MSYQGVTLAVALIVGVGTLAYNLYNYVNQQYSYPSGSSRRSNTYAPSPPLANRRKRRSKLDLSKGDVCTICQDELADSYIRLECQHHFHVNCLLQWKKQNNTCPICRDELNIRY